MSVKKVPGGLFVGIEPPKAEAQPTAEEPKEAKKKPVTPKK